VHLRELLRSQIDPNATLRRRMVSAILLGGNVLVRRGGAVGGDFRHLAACRAATQTHCIIAYSSFDQAPPPSALLVRSVGGISLLSTPPRDVANLEVLCVNPAALNGGRGRLDSYFRTTPFPGPDGGVWTPVPNAPTPWVEYPDLYTASCQHAGDRTWLQIDAAVAAGDARPRLTDTIGPAQGLHLWDANLAAGNLVGIVRQQSRAWRPHGGGG
jgi:hypothetical protein